MYLTAFDEYWDELGLTDEDRRELESRLLNNPNAGDVIPHTGGARKIRIVAKGHGKRGGARVIYVDFIIKDKTYFLDVYAKGEKVNLTEAEKKEIAELSRRLKNE